MPKDLGGLSLQMAKGRDTALLAKLNWRFHAENDTLWVRVLKKKYCTSQRINFKYGARLPSSPTRKGLKRGEDIFNREVKWIPGQGSNLNFQSDCWTNLGPIRHVIYRPIPQEFLDLKVKDFTTPFGWDWSIIPFEFPPNVKAEIQGVPTPIFAGGGDKLAWKPSSKGAFNMKSAYLLAINSSQALPFPESWIWKLHILPRIQAFVWKCTQESIKSRIALLVET